MPNTSEVSLYFCFDHVDTNIEESHPGYKFNWYPTLKTQKCCYDGCFNKAFNVFIGVKIPNSIEIPLNHDKAAQEILMEAKEALLGGPALDKLTGYLYFKIRVFSYDSGDFLAMQLLRFYAKILLRILKIEESAEFTEKDIKRLLTRLSLLPEGFKF